MAPMLSCWGLGILKKMHFFLSSPLPTPFLLFHEYFISLSCNVYIFLFHCFFEPLHHCCFVKLSHNFLTWLSKGQSRWLNLTRFSPLSLLWGPSNSTPSSTFLSHTAPSNGAALGLKQPPQHLIQPARGKVSLRENAGQQQPGPCEDREKATAGSAGRRLYMQHISRLSQSPQLKPTMRISWISHKALSWTVWVPYCISSHNNKKYI